MEYIARLKNRSWTVMKEPWKCLIGHRGQEKKKKKKEDQRSSTADREMWLSTWVWPTNPKAPSSVITTQVQIDQFTWGINIYYISKLIYIYVCVLCIIFALFTLKRLFIPCCLSLIKSFSCIYMIWCTTIYPLFNFFCHVIFTSHTNHCSWVIPDLNTSSREKDHWCLIYRYPERWTRSFAALNCGSHGTYLQAYIHVEH